jgi:hypothetical protein
MLNLFQHPTSKVCTMLATCPVGSRNKFGMTTAWALPPARAFRGSALLRYAGRSVLNPSNH